MIIRRGVSVRKFILYSLLSLALFLISASLFYFFNIFLFLNLFVSNLLADLVGLLFGFYVSKEKIFFYEAVHRVEKLSIYMMLRIASIALFSATAAFFHDFAIILSQLVEYMSIGAGHHFITKALMAPFSLVLNFLISFFAIEYVHGFFADRKSKALLK